MANENTPYIGENGNWYINGEDTGMRSQGEEGPQGPVGPQGLIGPKGKTGDRGPQGVKGDTIEKLIDTDYDFLLYSNNVWNVSNSAEFASNTITRRIIGVKKPIDNLLSITLKRNEQIFLVSWFNTNNVILDNGEERYTYQLNLRNFFNGIILEDNPKSLLRIQTIKH